MRHAIMLIVLLLLAYFGWQIASARGRKKIRSFLMKHGWRTALIVSTVLALLILTASINAISIL